MRTRVIVVAAALATAAARIGDSYGTNIHWTSALPGEAEMLSKAFTIARMDFGWASIEKTCGQYDFSAYDTLLATMKSVGVRPYWILDYGNPCYAPGGGPCTTPECYIAYGKFAQAAVAHFKGNNVLWESINEPNGMGKETAAELTAMALAVGEYMAAAGEAFVGPTTAGMDWGYLNATMADGILAAYTAVSVHPYRAGAPESVIDDYVTLRALIAQYAPGSGKPTNMPYLAGEWGYTSALPPCAYGNKRDNVTQGKFVARMWLADVLGGSTIGIAYDWKNDGNNVTDCESNFGSVNGTYTGNAAAPFQPKPAYNAALTFQNTVGNADSFVGRVPVTVNAGGNPAQPGDVFVLAFSGPGTSTSFAAWTNATGDQCPASSSPGAVDCGFYGIDYNTCVSTRKCCWDPSKDPAGPQCFYGNLVNPVSISFPVSPAPATQCFSVTDTFGASLPSVCATGGVVTMGVMDGPVYLGMPAAA